MLRGKDKNKDQTYFLNQLTQQQLSKVMFPSAISKKPRSGKLPESQFGNSKQKRQHGHLFYRGKKFQRVSQPILAFAAGKHGNPRRKVMGRHDGLMYYTIGQRHGLGIGGAGEPWFVIGKDLQRNVLYVGQGFHNDKLYSDSLIATDVNWISDKKNRNLSPVRRNSVTASLTPR